MTRYDIRAALGVLAAVVLLGLAAGYAIGWLTRPDAPLPGARPEAAIAFDAKGAADRAGPAGSTVPGYSDVYLNDYAELLDAGAETRIRDTLIGLYDRTGIEMTVLTLPQMSDYGHSGAIEPFATRLFNTWGIGNATRSDGVLVLVARQSRKMRIELGKGYGPDSDVDMQRVIDNTFLPAFRKDAYQDGIERGVDATILALTGSYPGDFDSGTLERGMSRIWRMLSDIGIWALGVVLAPVGAFAIWLRSYLRRRPRPCSHCGTLMQRAGEIADDAHLDGPQRLEEYLKSVDYDVWHCPACAHMMIEAYRSWFSRHSTCKSCGYRTLETTTTIVNQATKSSSGLKRLNYLCRNCHFHDHEMRTIPRESDDSSGSGRSSFGGGSSSGGGASGSW